MAQRKCNESSLRVNVMVVLSYVTEQLFLFCSLLWYRPSSIVMLKKFNYYCTNRRMSMHWYV